MSNDTGREAGATPVAQRDNGSWPHFPVQRYAVRFDDAIAERSGRKCPAQVHIMVKASDYAALQSRIAALEANLRETEQELQILKQWPEALEYLAGYHDNQAAAADAIGEPELAQCVKHHEQRADLYRTQAAALLQARGEEG